MNQKNRFSTMFIVKTGVMAALVCVITFVRFPLLGSKIHLANAFCLLAGLLFGPISGGLAAGIGSALYDALFGGYDLFQALITFASKFLMAFLCARIAYAHSAGAENRIRNITASVSGALLYVLLYMLKTFIYQRFVYGFPLPTVWVTMLSKLPASLLNAAAAIIVAPLLCMLIFPALKRLENR